MEQISREGHRKRMRANYLSNGIDNLPDHNIVELLLSTVIPRKDVKDVAYQLMNKFGSLEGIFSADFDELCEVNGIGENSAVTLMLVKDINRKIKLNRNKSVKQLTTVSQSLEYCKNLFENIEEERIILISLNNNLEIIDCSTISVGVVNNASVNSRTILQHVVKNNASSVEITHNHPHGNCVPSTQDINFTINVKELLRNVGVNLNDHIIVAGDNALSMVNTEQYMSYFD